MPQDIFLSENTRPGTHHDSALFIDFVYSRSGFLVFIVQGSF
jgi:hypothetical protein